MELLDFNKIIHAESEIIKSKRSRRDLPFTKVVPIIKCTCTSELFQLTHRYRYHFVGDVMTDM